MLLEISAFNQVGLAVAFIADKKIGSYRKHNRKHDADNRQINERMVQNDILVIRFSPIIKPPEKIYRVSHRSYP